jgi:uncharacterized protein
MRRFLAAAALVVLGASVFTPQSARAVSSDVVISEFRVRGPAGGNDEFVELYNLSSGPVDIGGWKMKGSNNAGTNSTRATVASGIVLGAGCHFLFVNTAAAGYSGAVPGNQTYATGITDDGGLAITTPGDVVVDAVGLSTGSAFKEGTPLASLGASNQNRGYERKPGGGAGSGTDTDNNAGDFQLIAPSDPQNLASPCGNATGPTGIGSATPSTVTTGAQTLLAVSVSPGTPAQPVTSVAGNLTSIGGAASQPFFDDGTNGDVTGGDSIYSFLATVPAAVPEGGKALPVTITDAINRTGGTSILLTVQQPPPAFVAIHDIQGSGARSPFEGQRVQTEGIVIARKSNGFFMQTAEADGDPNTSEGVFVFTSSAPPAAAAVGNDLLVVAGVQEFSPSADPNSPPSTELANATVTAIATGAALPAPVTITAADADPAGAVDELEKYEGMRVHVDSLTVVAPTLGFKNEAAATSTSSGVFYGVLTGTARPFREPGVQQPDPLPPDAPPTVVRFDANPERIGVDSDGAGGSPIDVSTGAVIANLTGVLDFANRTYTIIPDPLSPPAVTPGMLAHPVRARAAHEFTVATANIERFFDTVDDAGISDVKLTPAALANRLNKLSLQIRTIMGTPDIIGLEEVENLGVLQAIAGKINADAADPSVDYHAYLEEGNDPGGIDVGFLVNAVRVKDVTVTQFGKDEVFTNPNDQTTDLTFDRPPLVLHAAVATGADAPVAVTVIANHLRSLLGIDDPVDGPRVRAKRRAEAESLAQLVQTEQSQPNANVFVVGDFNADQFSDGYVDVIGTVKGAPAPADQVVFASADVVDPDLTDLVELAGTRPYSYTFEGSAEAIDHILVNTHALALFRAIDWGRSNADFPDVLRTDPNRPERISDHDSVVAYFRLPATTTTAAIAAPNPASYTQDVTLSASVTAADGDVPDGSVRFGDGAGFSTSAPVVNGHASVTVSAAIFGAPGTHGVGSHTIAADYADADAFAPSSGTATLVVIDDVPPVLSALTDIAVEATQAGGAAVAFTPTASDEVDGPEPVICAPLSGSLFPLGSTTVTCSAHDASNNTASGTFTVTVRDTTPPVIVSLTATPSVLFPANHKLVPVRVTAQTTDAADAAPVCTITKITSNDRDGSKTGNDGPGHDGQARDGRGDGDVDFLITGPLTALLRAEKNDGGSMIYTLSVSCRDGGGNAAAGSVMVTVPHSR